MTTTSSPPINAPIIRATPLVPRARPRDGAPRHLPFTMQGDLTDLNGQTVMRGGFMQGNAQGIALGMAAGLTMGASSGLIGMPQIAPNTAFGDLSLTRGEVAALSPQTTEALERVKGAVARGEASDPGEMRDLLLRITDDVSNLQRGIATSNTGFPVRENLEVPAAQLVPADTPLRNRLARIPGSGVAVAWRQLTSLGGGWGAAYDQPGGGALIRMFYPELGAPVEHTSVYAPKTAAYKLLGTLGSVSNFAQAAGLTYTDQMARERTNQMSNLMLNEEFALIHGNSTSTAVPWGDGTNALAFDGLMNLVTTANGTPSVQVQTAVGDLTLSHIDEQLTRITNRGGRGLWILMNSREAATMTRLLQAAGAVQRFVIINDPSNATMGFRVGKYIHTISGQTVDIIVDLFMLPGEMLFGADYLPDGSPVAQVSVLPQIPTELQPEKHQQIQGYTVTGLAASLTSPDLMPFMISSYEVLELRSSVHMGKSLGITVPS